MGIKSSLRSITSPLVSLTSLFSSSPSPSSSSESGGSSIGIRWVFAQSLSTLFIFILCIFIALNVTMSVLLYALASLASEQFDTICIGGSGEDLEDWFSFMDVVNLSWSTFTTVGYGNVFPMSVTRIKFMRDELGEGTVFGEGLCNIMNFFLGMEAFIGVMFTSFCAAVFFGKIMNLQRIAAVEFSNVCVVRTEEEEVESEEEFHAKGTEKDDNPTLRGINTSSSENTPSRTTRQRSNSNTITPYPILEFRLVNKNWGVAGSQILKAELSVSVALQSSRYDDALSTSRHITLMRDDDETSTQPSPVKKRLSSKFKYRNAKQSSILQNSTLPPAPTSTPSAPPSTPMPGMTAPLKSTVALKSPTGHIRYYPLNLELPVHPLLTKLFYGRHTLDIDSPLLTRKCKRSIRVCNGWSRRFNCKDGLKECLKSFENLVVVLHGTEISGGEVFAMQTYSSTDILYNAAFSSMYNPQSHLFDISRMNFVEENPDTELSYINDRHKLLDFIVNVREEKIMGVGAISDIFSKRAADESVNGSVNGGDVVEMTDSDDKNKVGNGLNVNNLSVHTGFASSSVVRRTGTGNSSGSGNTTRSGASTRSLSPRLTTPFSVRSHDLHPPKSAISGEDSFDVETNSNNSGSEPKWIKIDDGKGDEFWAKSPRPAASNSVSGSGRGVSFSDTPLPLPPTAGVGRMKSLDTNSFRRNVAANTPKSNTTRLARPSKMFVF